MNKNFFKKSVLLSLALSVTIISTTLKTFTGSTSDKNLSHGKKKSLLSPQEILYSAYLNKIYQTANLYATGLNEDVFAKAVTGFYNLKNTTNLNGHNSIITIVDFNKSSCAKRMWIVDLQSATLLMNTWVAHGQGSGDDLPNQFSNIDSSHQSSLGFYLTGEIYTGKHGRSLRLDGLDANFNTNARKRDIVVHGADYVSEQTIKNKGRLGRSFGCPAVSPELVQPIINLIKNKTVLYINGSDNCYSSKYLNQDLAANYLFPIANLHGPLQAML